MDARPIDVLNHAKGKRVLVALKNNRRVTGSLQALDVPHLNLWLNEAEVTHKDENGAEITTKYGKIFIRGDSVVFVSPE